MWRCRLPRVAVILSGQRFGLRYQIGLNNPSEFVLFEIRFIWPCLHWYFRPIRTCFPLEKCSWVRPKPVPRIQFLSCLHVPVNVSFSTKVLTDALPSCSYSQFKVESILQPMFRINQLILGPILITIIHELNWPWLKVRGHTRIEGYFKPQICSIYCSNSTNTSRIADTKTKYRDPVHQESFIHHGRARQLRLEMLQSMILCPETIHNNLHP